MIQWQALYNYLLETKQASKGEKHHIKPRHDGGLDKDGIVVLPRRYHVLAHYIRYRWLKQPGDRLAYKMMSGQLSNPMHDEVGRLKHQAAMQRPEVRAKLRVPRSEEVKAQMSVSRKLYIDSLEDRSVLTKHMQTEEVIRKRIFKVKQTNKNNPEAVKARQQKAANTVKQNNKNLTKEELKARYGQPKTQNGKWRGYLVIEKPQGLEVHQTISDAVKFYRVGMYTFLKYIKTGDSLIKGPLKGCKVFLTKEV